MSDLQQKEVIDVHDGKRVGIISDVIINSSTGQIQTFILELGRRNRGILSISSKEEYSVNWNQIIKIGEDIILVDTKKS